MPLLEARRHRRLRYDAPINWSIAAQALTGEGRLLDVSLTGARMRITGPINTQHGAVFRLASATIPALPPHARLRWFRRESAVHPHYLCGIVFETDAADHANWNDWVTHALQEADEQARKVAFEGRSTGVYTGVERRGAR